jgi:hypothetical protein
VLGGAYGVSQYAHRFPSGSAQKGAFVLVQNAEIKWLINTVAQQYLLEKPPNQSELIKNSIIWGAWFRAVRVGVEVRGQRKVRGRP